MCYLRKTEEYIKGECKRIGKDKPYKHYPKKIYVPVC